MKVDLTPAELDALQHILVQFDRTQLQPNDVYHLGCCYTKFRMAYQEAVKDIPGFSKEKTKEDKTLIPLSEEQIINICRALHMGVWYRSGIVDGEPTDLPLIQKWEALKWMLCEKVGVDVSDKRITTKK